MCVAQGCNGQVVGAMSLPCVCLVRSVQQQYCLTAGIAEMGVAVWSGSCL